MYHYGSINRLRSIEYPKDVSDAFWMISVGTQLSDKDEVLHMEQQSIREVLFEYLSFREVPYKGPALEFANRIQSLPLRFFALNTNRTMWRLEGT
jgi:hypothetical protein